MDVRRDSFAAGPHEAQLDEAIRQAPRVNLPDRVPVHLAAMERLCRNWEVSELTAAASQGALSFARP